MTSRHDAKSYHRQFDGVTRTPSDLESWACFKRPYEYGWEMLQKLCQTSESDPPSAKHLRHLKEFHESVTAALSPRALERIQQVLGPDKFRQAGGTKILDTADVVFATPEESESFDTMRSNLALSEETNLATLVMDVWATCRCLLRVSYNVPTVATLAGAAALDQSFMVPDESPEVDAEPRFFPRLWLSVHDYVVDRAAAAGVRVAREWRRHLYAAVPNLDCPLQTLIRVARDFDRRRSHDSGDARR